MEFSATSPFRFVRRLAAAGEDGGSLYLLVSDISELNAVAAETAAEARIQLGTACAVVLGTDVPVETLAPLVERTPNELIVIILDRWIPELVSSFDRHVVLLTALGTLVLLASADVAEHVLRDAPNLRSRLADVLFITPEAAVEESGT